MGTKLTPEIAYAVVAAIQQINCSHAEAAIYAGVERATLRAWIDRGNEARRLLVDGWSDLPAAEISKLAAALKIRIQAARPTKRELVRRIEAESRPYVDLVSRMERAALEGELAPASKLRELAMGEKVQPDGTVVQLRRTKIKRIRVPGKEGEADSSVVAEETDDYVGPDRGALLAILSRRYPERWRPPAPAEEGNRRDPREIAEELGNFVEQAIAVTLGGALAGAAAAPVAAPAKAEKK